MPATLDRLTDTWGLYASLRSPAYPGPVVLGTASSETLETRSGPESGTIEWRSWFDLLERQTAERAAQAFANRVGEIPEVRAVVLDTEDVEPRLTTYIDRRDLAVRTRIYDVEFELCQEANLAGVDFRVISMDNPACSIPGDDIEGIRVLYRRNSRDHA